MPDWKFSSAALYRTSDAIHKLIKIGLENSKLQSTGDLRQDFNLLVAEGKHIANSTMFPLERWVQSAYSE